MRFCKSSDWTKIIKNKDVSICLKLKDGRIAHTRICTCEEGALVLGNAAARSMKKFVLMYLYAILLGSVTSSPLPSTVETGSIYAVKNLVAILTTKNMSIRVRRYVSTTATWRSSFMQGYVLSTFSKKKNRGSTQ